MHIQSCHVQSWTGCRSSTLCVDYCCTTDRHGIGLIPGLCHTVNHHYVSIQVTYIGNTIRKHGYDFDERPVGTVVLADGEDLTSIFGQSDALIRCIGFTTSSGAIYGPWGDRTRGIAFSFDGPVYGLYGGLWGDVLSAFGTWTTDSPPPPSPTPVPNPPGLIRSKMFGGSSLTDNQWDDGTTFAGKPLCL
jgi:hypothetical protein